eukprot:2907625-Pleurochrysis_carterae.AAC.2
MYLHALECFVLGSESACACKTICAPAGIFIYALECLCTSARACTSTHTPICACFSTSMYERLHPFAPPRVSTSKSAHAGVHGSVLARM